MSTYRYNSQWIGKSTAHAQRWLRSESLRLGYVYPSRAGLTTSNLDAYNTTDRVEAYPEKELAQCLMWQIGKKI